MSTTTRPPEIDALIAANWIAWAALEQPPEENVDWKRQVELMQDCIRCGLRESGWERLDITVAYGLHQGDEMPEELT